jgi:hypothetical protein
MPYSFDGLIIQNESWILGVILARDWCFNSFLRADSLLTFTPTAIPAASLSTLK